MIAYEILEYLLSPLISEHNVEYDQMIEDVSHIHYTEFILMQHYTNRLNDKEMMIINKKN